jgi:signal transduction histidine kinase
MPPNRLPQLTLALLLAVAACVILGGAQLARRTESVCVERDRAPLRDFASVVEEQTRRLERLYESHLREIGDNLNPRNAATSREACERIVGLRQLSVLHADDSREADQHVAAMKPPAGEVWPDPTLREHPNGLPRPRVRLPQNEILSAHAEHAGWIDRPGEPLFYWLRRDWENVAIIFSIDRAEVAAAIDGWFRAWLASGAAGAFAGVEAAGGPDRLLGTRGTALGAVGPVPAHPDRPDFLLPLRSRFGTWHLASWDRHETRTSYHAPTLAAACALGIFTALLGFAVFAQQRRALALATQRVSFVNRVSHELRTPLTNILLNVDLAAEAASELPADATRRLGLVQEEARRLGRLIDNVLTFSRRERGKLQLDPRACVPASVVTAVVEQFAPSFGRRALAVRCTGEARMPCLLDADALAQIVANLLSNVEKYVPGGTVEIASTLADDALTVTVTDEGPGIPAEAAERIFRPFERLDSRVNEGASGTGLGLAIARDLAASMGGSLRLIPSACGAAFELRVPAPPAAPLTAVA